MHKAVRFFVKLFLTFVATGIAFGLVSVNTLAGIFWVSLAATTINYLLSDLGLLPRFGSLVSPLLEGGAGMLTAYLISVFTRFNTNLVSLVVFGAFVVLLQFFLQMFLEGPGGAQKE